MEENERRYSKDEVEVLRRKFDELAGVVGSMKIKLDDVGDMQKQMDGMTLSINSMQLDLKQIVDAMKGGPYNPEGMIMQIKKIKDYYEETKTQVTDIKFQLNKKNVNVNLIIALATLIVTLLVKTIWEFFTAKKP